MGFFSAIISDARRSWSSAPGHDTGVDIPVSLGDAGNVAYGNVTYGEALTSPPGIPSVDSGVSMAAPPLEPISTISTTNIEGSPGLLPFPSIAPAGERGEKQSPRSLVVDPQDQEKQSKPSHPSPRVLPERDVPPSAAPHGPSVRTHDARAFAIDSVETDRIAGVEVVSASVPKRNDAADESRIAPDTLTAGAATPTKPAATALASSGLRTDMLSREEPVQTSREEPRAHSARTSDIDGSATDTTAGVEVVTASIAQRDDTASALTKVTAVRHTHDLNLLAITHNVATPNKEPATAHASLGVRAVTLYRERPLQAAREGHYRSSADADSTRTMSASGSIASGSIDRMTSHAASLKQPAANTASRSTSAPAAPMVRIGQIDITVEAPTPVSGGATPASPAIGDLLSRRYLRGL